MRWTSFVADTALPTEDLPPRRWAAVADPGADKRDGEYDDDQRSDEKRATTNERRSARGANAIAATDAARARRARYPRRHVTDRDIPLLPVGASRGSRPDGSIGCRRAGSASS
jgi:hypothetical protein